MLLLAHVSGGCLGRLGEVGRSPQLSIGLHQPHVSTLRRGREEDLRIVKVDCQERMGSEIILNEVPVYRSGN